MMALMFDEMAMTSAYIPEPTDEEIRSIVNGAAVFSQRPEDLPCFRPLGDYTSKEIIIRMFELGQRLFAFNPSFKINDQMLRALVSNNIGVQPDFNDDHGWSFFMMRPSQRIDSAGFLSATTGLKRGDIQPTQSFAISRNALGIWHEVGHMHALMQDLFFDFQYESELYADKFALKCFVDRGGPAEAVKDFILWRALTAFLKQSPHYWLAPELKGIFNSKSNTIQSLGKLVNSYRELRFRSIAMAAGQQLNNHPSAAIERIMTLIDSEAAHTTDDDELANAALSYYEAHSDQQSYRAPDTKRNMLRAVSDVLQAALVSSFTRAVGAQVVEAAHLFCPCVMNVPRLGS